MVMDSLMVVAQKLWTALIWMGIFGAGAFGFFWVLLVLSELSSWRRKHWVRFIAWDRHWMLSSLQVYLLPYIHVTVESAGNTYALNLEAGWLHKMCGWSWSWAVTDRYTQARRDMMAEWQAGEMEMSTGCEFPLCGCGLNEKLQMECEKRRQEVGHE